MPKEKSAAPDPSSLYWKATPQVRRFMLRQKAQLEDARQRADEVMVRSSSLKAAVAESAPHPMGETSSPTPIPATEETAPPSEESANVFVSKRSGVEFETVTAEKVKSLVRDEDVVGIEFALPIRRPLVMKQGDSETTTAPARDERLPDPTTHNGEGVLIGIIDVEGFDFSHEDFLDENGETRFVSIWDQFDDGNGSNMEDPFRFDYGWEFKADTLNRAIRKAPSVGMAPYHLQEQSSQVRGSHGTHVASIAAGNHGICPKAKIAAVLVHLPTDHWDRRRTFTDSTRIADAIRYLEEVLKSDPDCSTLSINISLGTNGHAHDGTSGACQWIDANMNLPGRCVCIAAGNAGQESSESADDLGFVVGRIHTSGRIQANGLMKDLAIRVMGYPIEDVSENEIEIWYEPQDRMSVAVRPPGGAWLDWVMPGEQNEWHAEDEAGASLHTAVAVDNEIHRPENGSNRISVFLSPLDDHSVHDGVWTVRLRGEKIRDGRYHAWIERDDPVPVQGLTPQALWHYPSFFTEASNVDNTSLSTLACTRSAIAVANLDAKAERIARTSSQGPSRDGQQKPEICAPGTDIVAANGFAGRFDLPGSTYLQMTGTSMASPYVAGVAALMLQVYDRLTPAQIRGIMVNTARPLPGSDYTWQDDTGFGRIDATECVRQAEQVRDHAPTQGQAP